MIFNFFILISCCSVIASVVAEETNAGVTVIFSEITSTACICVIND